MAIEQWGKLLSTHPSSNRGLSVDTWGDYLRPEGEEKESSFTGSLGIEPIGGLKEPATSLDMSYRQMLAERSAQTELMRNRALFETVGRGQEFQEFVEKEGQAGIMGSVWETSENLLTPVFDLLSVGNYTVAGGVQEALRTGSVWEGFKQAAIEFGNAMPGLEFEEARRPSFVDIFGENFSWGSSWYGWAAGLAADILLDPVNLIPPFALSKGAKAGARVVGKGVRSRVPGLGRIFDELFVPRHQLKKTWEVGGKEISGRALLDLHDITEAKIDQGTARLLDKVDQMVSWMTPHERVLFVAAWDRPDLMQSTIERLAKEGIVDPQRIPRLQEQVGVVKDFLDAIYMGETAPGTKHLGGFLDKHAYRSRYMLATQTRDPRMVKAFEAEAARRAGKRAGTVPGTGDVFGPGQPKKFKTMYDRLVATLSGDLRDRQGNIVTMELDLGNVLKMRSIEHVRFTETHRMLDSIMDGHIGALVEPDEWKKAAKNPARWRRYRQSIKNQSPGYDVLEIKQTVRRVVGKDKKGRKVRKAREEIVGAYVLPEPVVKYIEEGERMFESEGQLSQFFDTVRKVTSVWKGWATFGTGFHIRNSMTMDFNNWLAGMKGKDLLLRRGQAFKLQCLADGQGKLPTLAAKAAQKVWGGVDAIPLPRVVVDGKELGPKEIMDLAERSGVIMRASKLYNLPEDIVTDVWQKFEPSVDVGQIHRLMETGEIDEVLGTAMTMGATTRMPPIRTALAKSIGNQSLPLQANRAVAQMTENNGRLALFLDRLAKGQDPIEAAKATKTWHFDYRNLTETEKKVFGAMIPFYAWTRFAAPRMVMALLEQPAKMSKLPKVKRAIEALSEDWQDLPTPDYYEEVQAMQLPLVRKDKPLFLQLDIPLNELTRLNKKDVLSSLHPILKTFVETTPEGGYSFFMGSPIERYPGEEGEVPGVSKMTEHTAMTFFPPLGKFVIRPLAAARKGELGQQLLSEFGGVRIRSLDVRRVLRAQTFQQRKLSRDYRRMLEQEGVLPQM